MDLLFMSKRIFLGTQDDFINGGIIVSDVGTIKQILYTPHELNTYLYNTESQAVYDFGDDILMPGLIDMNVHINEPGRKDWEGFENATKAAAAGGFTTIIDRPTNAVPPTTCLKHLKTKTATARNKIYIDVGFWGGLIPDNTIDLAKLLSYGVIGLQCTLTPIAEPVNNEFPPITIDHLEDVLDQFKEEIMIAIHVETPINNNVGDHNQEPKSYTSFLNTRPSEMEIKATQSITQLALKHKSKHFHLLNLSTREVLPLIAECKSNGGKLTAETCPHYLCLAAEDIEDGHTEFKTHPPIRSKENQPALWHALKTGCLDVIASNHSPATPGCKCLTYGRKRGNFLNAWPGIASLQLGLSVIWTYGQSYGLQLREIHQLMCQNPAKICGLDRFKGQIAVGYDADFCIWNPDEWLYVTPDMIYSTNKATPYLNQRLRGVVHATVVRGLHVYQQQEGFGQPLGNLLLRKTSSKKVVTFST